MESRQATEVEKPDTKSFTVSKRKRGRPLKGSRKSRKKKQDKKKKYIKKGEPGYVRPPYHYVKKRKTLTRELTISGQFQPYKDNIEELQRSNRFPSWMPVLGENMNLIREEYFDKNFLPSASISPGFMVSSSSLPSMNSEVNQLSRFQSLQVDQTSIIANTGGPIWALEWYPCEASYEENFLAVGVYNANWSDYMIEEWPVSSALYHTTSRIYNGPNMIQIWKLCVSRESEEIKESVTLSLGIVHLGAFVYDLKWMPNSSTTKNNDIEIERISKEKSKRGLHSVFPRLGILSVISGDGFLRLYSVPRPIPRLLEELREFHVHSMEYETFSPKLQLCSLFEYSYPNVVFTTIEWHPSQQALLLAGASDGTISIWNFILEERKQQQQQTALDLSLDATTQCHATLIARIQAHSLPVKSVVWSPYDIQFVSGGYDGRLQLWDMRNPFCPLFVGPNQRAFPQKIVWLEGSNVKYSFPIIFYEDKSIRIMDLTSFHKTKLRLLYSGDTMDNIWDGCISPGRPYLAFCTGKGNVEMIQIPNLAKSMRKETKQVIKITTGEEYEQILLTISFTTSDQRKPLAKLASSTKARTRNLKKGTSQKSTKAIVQSKSKLKQDNISTGSTSSYSVGRLKVEDNLSLAALHRIRWNACGWLVVGGASGLLHFQRQTGSFVE